MALNLSCVCMGNVLCLRQHQNKIAHSVYKLLKTQIINEGVADLYDILQNTITHRLTGSEFTFLGIARNIEEIKSTEDVDIIWIEEAEAVTEEQWDIIDPLARKQGAQIWIVFNPRLETDYIYRRFVINTPETAIARLINYTENPYCSPDFIKKAEAMRDENVEKYNHIYLGQPLQASELAIIKRKWLTACIDAHTKLGIEPTGERTMGFDIADAGGDRCVTINRYGQLVYKLKQWKASEDQLLLSCKKAFDIAAREKSRIIYDSIGVGASAGAKFSELNAERKMDIKYQKCNSGLREIINGEHYYDKAAKIKNKDMFANIKAQMWWNVADRARVTYNAVVNHQDYDPGDIISFAPEMDKLEELMVELCIPEIRYDGTNKVMVENKKELAKRGIPSHDLADAFVMSEMPVIRFRGAFL